MIGTLTKEGKDEMPFTTTFEINENSSLLSPFEVQVSKHLLTHTDTQGSDGEAAEEGKENVEEAQKDVQESPEDLEFNDLQCEPKEQIDWEC